MFSVKNIVLPNTKLEYYRKSNIYLSKTIGFEMKYSNIVIFQIFSEVFGDPWNPGIDLGRAPEIRQRLQKIIGIFEYLNISFQNLCFCLGKYWIFYNIQSFC